MVFFGISDRFKKTNRIEAMDRLAHELKDITESIPGFSSHAELGRGQGNASFRDSIWSAYSQSSDLVKNSNIVGYPGDS